MELPVTGVRFEFGNERYERLVRAAQACLRGNIRQFGSRPVLVEGAGYEKIWLETQPMGGENAFFYCPEAAANDILLFMENQRADGRLPGSIANTENGVVPQYNKLQGFCFPLPALRLYYLTGRDPGYLDALYRCLEGFDAWLQKTRALTGNGVLSSFCVYDTGEDNALRYGDAPCYAEEDLPPSGNRFVPMQSMDITSFSYSCRETLARIAAIRKDETQEKHWLSLSRDTARALKKELWNEKRGACFDRYSGGSVCDVLCHNSLRCMYWHSFDPDMAGRFVKEHLLNEKEFFTPVPLPSVAVNDPLFANRRENDWSGQPEGLTFQRAVDALENYGFHSLVPLFGQRLFDAVEKNGLRFTQQYDPFTGEASSEKGGYGPTALAVLEYMSHMHGVDADRGRIRFSDTGGVPFLHELTLGSRTYSVESDGKQAKVVSDGREYALPAGHYLITDEAGNEPVIGVFMNGGD